MRYIAPIVEGHGEIKALLALLHRIAQAVGYQDALLVNAPLRVKAKSFLRKEGDYFHRHVALAAAKAAQMNGMVLVLLDCEDDCPATVGPDLMRRAQSVRSDVPMLVALAYREYETWFLTAAESLRGECGLPSTLQPPPAPEGIRDAKGWLGRHMPVKYDPIVHQLRFTRRFDLGQARENPSFNRFFERIEQYLAGD